MPGTSGAAQSAGVRDTVEAIAGELVQVRERVKPAEASLGCGRGGPSGGHRRRRFDRLDDETPFLGRADGVDRPRASATTVRLYSMLLEQIVSHTCV